MVMRDRARIQAEIRLLEMNYRRENVFWAADLRFLGVWTYCLPPGYNRQTTPILVPVPERYGNDGCPYMDFFVKSGLRINQGGTWSELPHYFDRFPYDSRLSSSQAREIMNQGWSYLCLHPKDWKPSHNILIFLSQVYLFLCDPFRDWDRENSGGFR